MSRQGLENYCGKCVFEKSQTHYQVPKAEDDGPKPRSLPKARPHWQTGKGHFNPVVDQDVEFINATDFFTTKIKKSR